MTDFFANSLCPLLLTLGAFRIGQLCQAKWKTPLCNPIIVGMVLVIGFLLATGMDPVAYREANVAITWLMTPATVAFAIPMYEQFRVLRKNLKAIVAGVAAGAVSCLAVLLVAGLLLGLDHRMVISILPKSVTTAIGVVLSEMSGGIGAVTTVAIIITGNFANMMGVTFCRIFRITHPVAQGAAFGTAGHVVATAKARELSELTGAVSSLSLVVAGLITSVVMPMVTAFL